MHLTLSQGAHGEMLRSTGQRILAVQSTSVDERAAGEDELRMAGGQRIDDFLHGERQIADALRLIDDHR